MSKKYKIKEECKKYFDVPFLNAEYTQERFHQLGLTLEALEEVEEKIEVYFSSLNGMKSILKASGKKWTEQERADIEKFLNVFGSWDELEKGWNNSDERLDEFIKEKGYD